MPALVRVATCRYMLAAETSGRRSRSWAVVVNARWLREMLTQHGNLDKAQEDSTPRTLSNTCGRQWAFPAQSAVPGSTTHSACSPLTEAIMSKSPS